MNKRTVTILLISVLMTLSFLATCFLFDTDLANSSIDWLSFAAGIFLAVEGLYKLSKLKNDPLSLKICRALRIVIGGFIFSVHLVQFIWGIDAPVFAPASVTTTIDWLAFIFGIFLIIEGLARLSFASNRELKDQILRGLRVMLGTVVFTIHLLQFMRY